MDPLFAADSTTLDAGKWVLRLRLDINHTHAGSELGSEPGLLRPPTTRQRQINLADGMLGDAGEHIRHPSLWIHFVQAGGLGDRAEDSRALGAAAQIIVNPGIYVNTPRIAVPRKNISRQLEDTVKQPPKLSYFCTDPSYAHP